MAQYTRSNARTVLTILVCFEKAFAVAVGHRHDIVGPRGYGGDHGVGQKGDPVE